MEWWKQLEVACEAFNLEPVIYESKIYIIGAVLPGLTDRDNLVSSIPQGMEFEFIRGMKKSTKDSISNYLKGCGFKSIYLDANSDGLVVICANTNSSVPMPEDILSRDVMKVVRNSNDQFVKDVRFVLQSAPEVPAGQSNPIKVNTLSKGHNNQSLVQRQEYGFIQKDDILNLKITLGNAGTVDDFLKAIGA